MKRQLDMVVLVGVLALFLVLNGLLFGRAARVARRTEIVPVPSSYRATPSGCRALYELLGRVGVPTGRWTLPLTQPLPPDATVLVMLEPGLYVRPIELRVLRHWVDRGGTLIVASEGVTTPTSPVRAMPEHLFVHRRAGVQPEVAPAAAGHPAPQQWSVQHANRYLQGVAWLELDPARSVVGPAALLRRAQAQMVDLQRAWVVAGDPAAPLCTASAIGRGRVFYLATPAWFANGQLDRADNAIFVLNLLTAHRGSGRVLFDEYHLGNLGAGSLAAWLWQPPWRFVVVWLLLAGLLAAVRCATRLGPPRLGGDGAPRRPAAEFIAALAALHRRAGARREIARMWYDDTRRRLCRLAGSPQDLPDQRLVERLRHAGHDAAAIEAMLAGWRAAAEREASETELLALARQADQVLRRCARRRGGSQEDQH